MKIDLLPARYHRVRELERQIAVAGTVLTVVGIALITSFVVVRAQSEAYRLRIHNLNNVAGQYKVVNDSYVGLKEAEQRLSDRRNLLQPLIDRKGTVLTVLDGLRYEFPSGVQLTAVAAPAGGELTIGGRARDFAAVGRFMTWLSERKGYREVTLVSVSAEEGAVTFRVTAEREGGTPVEAAQ